MREIAACFLRIWEILTYIGGVLRVAAILMMERIKNALKMNIHNTFALIILLVSVACEGENLTILEKVDSRNKYVICDRNMKIRNAPDTSALEVGLVYQGDLIEYLGKRSKNTYKVRWKEGINTNYWFNVRLPNGKEGWIFGGGIRFTKHQTNELIASLCYPSDYLPRMKVYLKDINSSKVFSVTSIENQKNVKFKNIPNGSYYAYAYTIDKIAGLNGVSQRISGAFTNAVLCGLNVKCKDHTLIPIKLSGGIYKDTISICDFYGAIVPPEN